MPIDTSCSQCGQRLRVADDFAGRKAQCPKCQSVVQIPGTPLTTSENTPSPATFAAAATSVASSASTVATASNSAAISNPADAWYMQTGDNQRYGPIAKAELDHWMAEGRIDHECQILQQGWEQWRWAEQVYPELASDLNAALASQQKQPAYSPAVTALGKPLSSFATQSPTSRFSDGTAGFSTINTNPYAVPNAPSQHQLQESGGTFSSNFVRTMVNTRPWVRLVGVMSVITGSLYAIATLVHFYLFSQKGGLERASEFITYSILSVTTFGIGNYSLRFATRLNDFVQSRSADDLDEAASAQFAAWRLTGISFIVMIAVIGVLFCIGFAIGLTGALNRR